MDTNERRRRASAEAAEWLVRLQMENVSRESREQFVAWLRESSLHVAELLRVNKVHGALTQFKRWAEVADQESPDASVVAFRQRAAINEDTAYGMSNSSRASTRGALPTNVVATAFGDRRRKFTWVGSIAAGLVAAIVATWLYVAPGTQVIQIDRGERREVALSDGSVVSLDPDTRLRVRFESHTRRVYLDSGRALFRVAKNPDRPFLVLTNDTAVRAVGTEFGVERQQQNVVVTVSEGKVGVFFPGAINARRVAAQSRKVADETFLVANEQVTVHSSRSDQPVVRQVDSERELAWAHGLLVFDNDTVADVIGQFNRYNRVQLHVTDSTLAKRPVSGTFEANDPESFVAFVEKATAVRIVRGANQDITLAPAQKTDHHLSM